MGARTAPELAILVVVKVVLLVALLRDPAFARVVARGPGEQVVLGVHLKKKRSANHLDKK